MTGRVDCTLLLVSLIGPFVIADLHIVRVMSRANIRLGSE